MHYGASFLAYAIGVYKNATQKNWLMRVKGLTFITGCFVKHQLVASTYGTAQMQPPTRD